MMKKQRFIWMLAAILTLSGATMTLTSCRDDEPSMPDVIKLPEDKTEDAMRVTTNKSYMLYGQWDDEFGQALGRRLQGSMGSPATADLFVIDPSSFAHSSIDNDDLKTIIRRSETGEASIVLTKATFREFYDWAQLYVLGYLLIAFENYYGDLGSVASYDSPEAAPMRKKVANIIRNAYITSQQHSLPSDCDGNGPRRTSVNDMELDWEHVKDWPEEKQNAIMFDGFAQSEGNELFVLNAEACLVAEDADARIEQPDNDYEWGLKADAVADWLNRQDDDAVLRRAGLKRLARAVTSSGDSEEIGNLMNAQTKDFVFDYQYPSLEGPYVETAFSAIKVQYRAYSAYDFSGDKEYYQVIQNIIVMNDQIHSEVNGNLWWDRFDDGDFTVNRGAWMKRIDTRMWLEGSGTKSIISAAPLNENGSSSGSSSSGTSSGTTTGCSDGCSVGVSGGVSGMNPTFSASSSVTHTDSYSRTKSTTWNTSTNWSTRDLTTNFVQSNDANGTVSWTHSGNTPTTDEGTQSVNVKTLLKSTCVTDENVLWMIEHPSGSYTLKANFNVVSEIVKVKENWSKGFNFVPQDNSHSISFDLWTPNRFKRIWNNVIYNYGTGQGDPSIAKELRDFINSYYGNNLEDHIFCWSGYFTSTEATADGSANARAVFQTFKNSIRGMKQALRADGYGGRLVFGLKLDGEEELLDSIVLDLNQTFNVGETLTEQVNGYGLTFMVTKKNQQVELYSVPVDFQGELVIPSIVLGLEVTALGNDCANSNSGITAVTVPEGVTYIGDWAFYGVTELTKVYLPSTLTMIDYGAFMNTNQLTEVHINATTPPTMDHLTFDPRYNDATLYVPHDCIQTYRDAWGWSKFKIIVEE